MSTRVWVVAQVKSIDASGWAQDWSLGGIFSSEEAALAVCTEPGDAVWPVELDTFLGRDTTQAPGAVWPAGQPGGGRS